MDKSILSNQKASILTNKYKYSPIFNIPEIIPILHH